ncbi:MAG: hypothetical protein K1000chlam1_00325 [Candidatus Anoxychlamydiales bacterium]|nr:hypothetical protein [Candidatus Anoxychlamydiales bacterium]
MKSTQNKRIEKEKALLLYQRPEDIAAFLSSLSN